MTPMQTAVLAVCALMPLATPALALDCHNGFPYQGGAYGVASVTAPSRAYF